MRRETREEAISRADRASRDAFALQMCLRAVMDGDAKCVARVTFGDTTVSAYVVGPERADGGFVCLRGRIAGQSATVSAFGLLDWLRERRDYIPSRFDAETVAWNKLTEAVSIASNTAQAA